MSCPSSVSVLEVITKTVKLGWRVHNYRWTLITLKNILTSIKMKNTLLNMQNILILVWKKASIYNQQVKFNQKYELDKFSVWNRSCDLVSAILPCRRIFVRSAVESSSLVLFKWWFGWEFKCDNIFLGVTNSYKLRFCEYLTMCEVRLDDICYHMTGNHTWHKAQTV